MNLMGDTNTSTLKNTIFFVISVCFVSLATLPFNGYCDNWVDVESNINFTNYYKSSSVKIDKQNKIITVWVKHVYTDKGKISFLKDFDSIDKQKYNDISYTLGLMLLDYRKWKYSFNHLTFYSKSGNVIYDGEFLSEWNDTQSPSTVETLFKKILHDYNIMK